MKKTMMIMAMVAVIGMAGTASAAVFTFDGGAGGLGTDWNTAANWNPESGWSNTLSAIGGGDTFTVGGAFSPTNAVQSELGNGGTAGETATLNINTSGTLTFSNGLWVGRSRDAQITQTDGNFVCRRLVVGRSDGSGDSPTTSRYDMDGGTLTDVDHTTLSEGPGGIAVFEQTAGAVILGSGDAGAMDAFQMSVNVTGTSTYQISGGSFDHDGGHFVLGGYVDSNQTPQDGGTALFEVIGTTPTSVSTTGDVLVYDGGTMKFTMDAGGVTKFTATGSVDVSLGSLAIDMSLLGSGVGDILLIDSSNPITGPFANAAEGDPYGTYTLSYLGLDGLGNDLVLLAAPIPEPAGVGLIGLALLAVRKRRNA